MEILSEWFRYRGEEQRISEYVVSELLHDGIIVLDIHDSFIVQRSYQERLKEIMVEGFENLEIISIPDITNNQ